jgi:predicted AAA+ superfamily ATPase
MFQRFVGERLALARLDTPVILLAGARQVGKSTLARAAARSAPGEPIRIRPDSRLTAPPERYVTLDDATIRAAAAADPQTFVERYRDTDWIVFDEVQRVPELLIAIKRAVDADRRPGRFLLTGSANVMTIPATAESLAGRLEMVPIWPLAQAEIEGFPSNFITRAFETNFPAIRVTETVEQIAARALRGGYPEPLQRTRADRRDAWFGNYIATVVAREIASISAIEDTTSIVRVLRALASRSGGPRNLQTLSNDAGLRASTLTRYVALLEATFLVRSVVAWSNNVDARIMKSPKLLITDSGLYGYLLGLHERDDAIAFLIETFVGCELHKLASWSAEMVAVMHFRDKRGNEVDFVLEQRDRRVVGIEVKKSRSVQLADLRGLQQLAQAAGDRFVRGILLYGGNETVPFGPQLVAAPLATLWTNPA